MSESNAFLTKLTNHDQNTDDGRYCPKCGGDWRASQIPQKSIDKGYYGPVTTEPRFYSHLVGIEIRGKYDGVSEWMCPHCGTHWDRWTGDEIRV